MKAEKKQLIILTKHFFKSFFENEDISSESNSWKKLITVLFLLGIIAGFLSHILLKRYFLITYEGDLWVEKFFFITFFMIVMGVLSVLQWRNVFLDSRDHAQLSQLPIKDRTLFLSKFLSLLGLIGFFFLSTTLLSSFIFPIYLSKTYDCNVFSFLYFSCVHSISCFLAYSFIFILCNLFNGILMLTLSNSLYERITTHLQVFLFIIFSFSMIFFVSFYYLYPEMYSSFSSLKESGSKIFYILPSFWFVGLYEYLLGKSDPLFQSLTMIALLATLIVIVLFVWVTLLNYRNIKRFEGTRKANENLRTRPSSLKKIFNSLVLRNSVQRATFYFFFITLKKIKKYKLMLGGYLAMPISLYFVVIMALKFTNTYGTSFLYERLILTLPHILTIFLVVGARIISNYPESLESNWIFRILEDKDSKHYLIGLKKGIFFLLVLPLLTLLFIFYVFFLPLTDVLLHMSYSLLNSLIIIYIIFMNYPKIPFTCSYEAVGINFSKIWIGIGLLSYIYAASNFGHQIIKHPYLFSYYLISVFILMAVLLVVRKNINQGENRLVFEEDSRFRGLEL